MEAKQTLEEHAGRVCADARPLEVDVDPAVYGVYRGYAQLVTRWRDLAAGGARSRHIGRTVDGSPMYALEVGPADATSVSTVIAGIHPIEWIGVEVMLGLLARLVDNPPAGRRVVAFPLVNVDGYQRVERNLRAGRRSFVRTNSNGVDLNRNWPIHFRQRRKRKPRLVGWNYGGAHALSEPEVAAVVAALDDIADTASIDVALSLHSIGRMILMPFGGRWRPPQAIGRLRTAAEAVRARLKTRYTVKQSSHWVPGAFAYGMELDHLHARYGATALLVECSRGGATLGAPSSLVNPFRWFNPARPAPVVDELAAALEPFLRGR